MKERDKHDIDAFQILDFYPGLLDNYGYRIN